jgi:hypothetical protein
MAHSAFIPLPAYQGYSTEEMKRRTAEFYSDIQRRRTFANTPTDLCPVR